MNVNKYLKVDYLGNGYTFYNWQTTTANIKVAIIPKNYLSNKQIILLIY